MMMLRRKRGSRIFISSQVKITFATGFPSFIMDHDMWVSSITLSHVQGLLPFFVSPVPLLFNGETNDAPQFSNQENFIQGLCCKLHKSLTVTCLVEGRSKLRTEF